MKKSEVIAKLIETATLAGPVTEGMIRSAEDELQVWLPPSYREFLSSCGAALCAEFEIAGLFTASSEAEPPLWTHVVTATCEDRTSSHGALASGYVHISDDGGDYTFYLDTSHPGSGGECPVVVLGPGADYVVVAEDFLDFVVRAVENRISF